MRRSDLSKRLALSSSPSLHRLSDRWKRAPRRWGHPVHSLCSYFAMFPPRIPHVFIEWLTEAGDVVYDPFCGRGTAPLEAVRTGRIGLGSDLNPLAVALSNAKLNPPTEAAAMERLRELRLKCVPADPADAPEHIRMLYSPLVMGQLIWLRGELDKNSTVDCFLLATLLGLLHANYQPGKPARGLSISMPNTFSMSPAYVKKYIAEHGLTPPPIDTFELLGAKLKRLHLPSQLVNRGSAWLQDARKPAPTSSMRERAKLIFTSPPYLKVIAYGKYNWVRLWMLGEDPKEVDKKLISTASMSRYQDFMGETLDRFREVIRSDGFVCLMVGDVLDSRTGKEINLAQSIWENIAREKDWHKVAIINDHLPTAHKVSRIWKSSKGNATKTDRILILTPEARSTTSLPVLRRMDWSKPLEWAK